MDYPDVEIRPSDTIFKADERVENAFEAAGLGLMAFDGLNSLVELAPFCHFFQVVRESQDGGTDIVVVVTKPWDEKIVIKVLNYLLEILMDPDPPGSRVKFQFYSPYDVPKVLLSVFGTTPCCHFECRSLLVARFGHELKPDICQQLAATAAHLTTECFQTRASLFDPHGGELVERLVEDRFIADSECLEPINALISLGCFYGETMRAQVATTSAWAAVKECAAWPGIVFAPPDDDGEARVVFNPIAVTRKFYRSRKKGSLVAAGQELVKRCHEILGVSRRP